jgi:hypothetical protein
VKLPTKVDGRTNWAFNPTANRQVANTAAQWITLIVFRVVSIFIAALLFIDALRLTGLIGAQALPSLSKAKTAVKLAHEFVNFLSSLKIGFRAWVNWEVSRKALGVSKVEC